MKEYFFRKEFYDIAKLQVTQIENNKSYYLKISMHEYEQIKDYIGMPNNILELGCGLGRFSIFLNSKLNHNPKFFLADFSKVSKNIKYGWNPKNSSYNNLSFTRDFCLDNGMNNFDLINLGENSIGSLKNIDLIMSFLSVGFHYPIEDYFDDFKLISNENTVFIFGTRDGVYDFTRLSSMFEDVIILDEPKISTKERIVVLKKIRKEML